MARKIAICTHKGGTGKTVTALALATGFAREGHRCLLIDLDPQGHSTIGIGGNFQGPTLKEFFEQHPTLPFQQITYKTPVSDRLQIAPSDLRLAWTAEGLGARPKREELLKRSLAAVEAQYDWIFMDTPPSLGVLTQNAVNAADFLVIPTLAEARATNAIVDLLELVSLMKGDSFEDYRILLTRVDGRKSRTNHAVLEALQPWIKKIFDTVIPQCEALNQAQMTQQDIYSYDPASTGALSYQDLIHEIQNL